MKGSKVIDNLLVQRAELSDVQIVVAGQQTHVLKVRDVQVVVVLLHVHTGQVVVESRHNGPCCSRSKSILTSKESMKKYVRCRGLSSPPANSKLQGLEQRCKAS